jgi:hypothetical protein
LLVACPICRPAVEKGRPDLEEDVRTLGAWLANTHSEHQHERPHPANPPVGVTLNIRKDEPLEKLKGDERED